MTGTQLWTWAVVVGAVVSAAFVVPFVGAAVVGAEVAFVGAVVALVSEGFEAAFVVSAAFVADCAFAALLCAFAAELAAVSEAFASDASPSGSVFPSRDSAAVSSAVSSTISVSAGTSAVSVSFAVNLTASQWLVPEESLFRRSGTMLRYCLPSPADGRASSRQNRSRLT